MYLTLTHLICDCVVMSIYQRLRDTQPELMMLKVLLLYGLPTLPLHRWWGQHFNTYWQVSK